MTGKIVIATGNEYKLREMKSVLKKLSPEFQVISIIELERGWKGVKEEDNYARNALLKAASILPFVSEEFILAEDSGIEVFALDGRPGPHSSRYAGEHSSDEEKIKLLLSELKGKEDRTCRYVCSVVLMNGRGQYIRGWGEVRGIIADAPSGSGGFGYDPVFFIPEKGKTFAELSIEEKCEISHRGKAIRSAFEKAKKLNFFNA